jgi:hypothetical protein
MMQERSDDVFRLFTGRLTAIKVQAGTLASNHVEILVLDTLCEHLIHKPGLYIGNMVTFLWKEFNIFPSHSSIQQALSRRGWNKKNSDRKLNSGTRGYELSINTSYPSSGLDESGCDKRIGCRQTGWSPLGVTSVQLSKFHRGQRYQILPAYTQDGIIISNIFQGSTNAAVFENFIKQLLWHCQRYPTPRSALVIDNASFSSVREYQTAIF